MKESDNLKIRRGKLEDASALAKFGARTFLETYGADNTVEDIESYIVTNYGDEKQRDELRSSDIITILAQDREALVGYAQIRRAEAPDSVKGPSPVELWRIYVDRPWHGRGIGKLLVDAVHEAANELGGRTIWLSVWEQNERAIAFYRKCGFKEVGTKDFWVGSDRQRDYVMVVNVRSV
ncbi:MAG: GNAT family N-acetyltransferase [Anaerolineales bacterium]|nr:GNAT family N-acetyltransferase [Anaerolineales bacterium]